MRSKQSNSTLVSVLLNIASCTRLISSKVIWQIFLSRRYICLPKRFEVHNCFGRYALLVSVEDQVLKIIISIVAEEVRSSLTTMKRSVAPKLVALGPSISILIQSITLNLRCLLPRMSRSCDILIGNGLSGSSRSMIISLSWLEMSTSFSEFNLPSGLKMLQVVLIGSQ